jgi:hypothetical protein
MESVTACKVTNGNIFKNGVFYVFRADIDVIQR